MRDFRIPYKDNSQQHSSSLDNANSDYRRPPEFQSRGSSLSSFIVLVGFLSAISFFIWIGWQNRSTADSSSSLESYITKIATEIQNIFSIIESATESEDFEPIVDDSTSVPVEGNVFYISEYHYGYDGKRYIVYGLLDNTSEITQEKITISAKDPKTEESFNGIVYTKKLYPHKKIPFIIPMDGWKGENEIEFYTDSQNSEDSKLPPLYQMKAGDWDEKGGIWNYISEFTHLDTDPLESGAIILVIRDSENKILNFVTYALPILNGSISVGEKLNIEIPFQDATNEPEVTEVYFTKSL